MTEILTCLLVGMEAGSDGIEVPVIMENVRASEHPQYRAATDEEYDRYLSYWNSSCPDCGRERGDCQLRHELATPMMRCVDCGAAAYIEDGELVCRNGGDASHQKALSELFGSEPLIRFVEEA